MAYDPVNNVIYEVNHPTNSQGNEANGLWSWIDGFFMSMNTAGIEFDNTKSVASKWDMTNDRQAAAFWSREYRNDYLLAPVTISGFRDSKRMV